MRENVFASSPWVLLSFLNNRLYVLIGRSFIPNAIKEHPISAMYTFLASTTEPVVLHLNKQREQLTLHSKKG